MSVAANDAISTGSHGTLKDPVVSRVRLYRLDTLRRLNPCCQRFEREHVARQLLWGPVELISKDPGRLRQDGVRDVQFDLSVLSEVEDDSWVPAEDDGGGEYVLYRRRPSPSALFGSSFLNGLFHDRLDLFLGHVAAAEPGLTLVLLEPSAGDVTLDRLSRQLIDGLPSERAISA